MKSDFQNTLTIHSPEGVSFSIPLAGPMSRFLAWMIDVAAIFIATVATNVVIGLLRFVSLDAAQAVYIGTTFAIIMLYGIVLEWFWRGQTIGKRIMRLRVIDDQGLKLRFEQVVLRNLLRIVDRLPLFYMVGGLSCVLSKRNQRLGDLAAGTVVTYAPDTAIPDVGFVIGDKYNSFRNHPHLEARLRQLTPPAAAALALDAIARRDNIDADERIGLFSQFAEYFRGIVSFPEEDQLGITDEQYVRNVIDSIYNARESKRRSA